MKSIRRTTVVIASLSMVGTALDAQSISLGLRGTGSIPTGAFAGTQASGSANDAVIQGAKSGFGYGLDAGVSLGMIGVYAGFDHVQFDCETATCRTDGKYTLQGATVGVRLSATGASMIRPFVRGGITFNDLKGAYGGSSSSSLTTDYTPGYEIGAGIDISLGGIFSFTPQARYIGQNLKAKIPGVNTTNAMATQGVNYMSFDLGLSLHTPFGR
jgi:hypothetical protein